MNYFPSRTTRISRFLAVLLVSLAATLTLSAQAPTATLTGTVTDVSKAAIPDAGVEVRNTATNEVRSTKTNGQGEFTVTTLDPGPYQVTVTHTGFRSVTENRIELEAAQTARVDVALPLGNVTETVAVSATDVGLLNTETSTKGTIITPVEVAEIPLVTRDFNDLALTVVGVQPPEQKAKGASYVANGSRADSAGIYVDGINDESPRDAGSQISPPLDSIQEFRMETADYTAQYGRLGGSVVNLAIKTGTNRYHGSLFDFVRNDFFDAEPYSFTGVSSKTKLRKNQFGADFSGPIVIPHIYNGHDRTFFNVNLEWIRNIGGSIALTTVPTALERAGDFSQSLPNPANPTVGLPYYFHNPAKPLSATCGATGGTGCLYAAPYDKIPTLDPVAKALLAYIPLPNIPNFVVGSNNYQYISNKVGNDSNSLVKINHKLTGKDELQGLFDRHFSSSSNPTGGSPLGRFAADTANGILGGDFGSVTSVHDTLIGFGETHIFTPNLVNNLHLGRTRTTSAATANDAGTNYAALLGIAGTVTGPANLLGFPSFKPSGAATIGDSASDPITYVVNDYDGSNLTTWNRGRHTFTFGADILHVQLFQPTNTNKNGAFTYSGKFTSQGTSDAIADLLAGYPATSGLMTGGSVNHLIDTNYAFFAQDDFKVSHRLTLNLGLRYEFQTLPAEENGQLVNFVPSLGKIVYAGTTVDPNISTQLASAGLSNYYVSADSVGLPSALINTNKARLAPRLGFAFRPLDNDKLVVRGGYGLFYTGIRLTVIRTNLAGGFPYSVNTTYQASAPSSSKAGSSFISSTNPFPTAGGSLSGILTPSGYDPNAAPAYMQNYNLTIERELPWHIGLETSYVGSKGTHLPQEQDYNQERIANTASSRPLPTFGEIDVLYFNGISHYDSLQVSMRRRFQHGLFFRVNYTYGKSLDTQSGANYGGGGGYFANQDVTNPNAEYGLSDFDIRHNFSSTVVYRVPGRHYILKDWQVSGIAQFYSGQPFTPTISGTRDLGVATRPDRVCDGNISNPSRNHWFDTSCFTTPKGQYGTAGRNIIIGPDYTNINLAVGRVFSLERFGSFEFRLEAFNALNHPNLGYPTAVIGSSNTPGVITSINGNQRLVQLSGRYSF